MGEEPTSQVTSIYNRVLCEELPRAGVACTVIPRLAQGDTPVSASNVRRALQVGDLDALRALVPDTTYRYFTSEKAAPVIERSKAAGDVAHY